MLKYISILFVFMNSCVSVNDTHYGVQDNQLASLPARIAVISCQNWPNSARMREQAVSNVAIEEQERLCREFDKAVIKGFASQPFMRGYSPKIVTKLLKMSGKQDLPGKLAKLWTKKKPCAECNNVVSKYNEDVADSEAWRMWLEDFSKATRNTDAVLFPFVLYLSEHHVNDRGLEKAIRASAIAMLLIDTGNGDLIWSSYRKTNVENQDYYKSTQFPSLEFPDWKELYARLFTNDLWNEFPGRQN